METFNSVLDHLKSMADTVLSNGMGNAMFVIGADTDPVWMSYHEESGEFDINVACIAIENSDSHYGCVAHHLVDGILAKRGIELDTRVHELKNGRWHLPCKVSQ